MTRARIEVGGRTRTTEYAKNLRTSQENGTPIFAFLPGSHPFGRRKQGVFSISSRTPRVDLSFSNPGPSQVECFLRDSRHTNLNHAARQVPLLIEHRTDANRNGVGLINPFTSHAPPAPAPSIPIRRLSPSSGGRILGWLLRDCCGVSNIANYFISAVPVTSSVTLLQFFSNLLRPTSQRAWFDKPF